MERAAGAPVDELPDRAGQVGTKSRLAMLIRRNDQFFTFFQGTTHAPQEVLLLWIGTEHPAGAENKVVIR